MLIKGMIVNKLLLLAATCLLLNGCVAPGAVSGAYETEYQARGKCAYDASKLSGWKESFTAANFKAQRRPDGDWQCIQVYGSVLDQQIKDSRDEYYANIDGVSLETYKQRKADSMKRIEQAYKDLFMAKERLYEDYRKDGKLHTDTYTLPDGSVRSVTIQGDKRCESYVDASGSSSSCI